MICMSAPRNKAERLAVAGAVAPSLRSGAERAKARRIAREKDGKVVGYTTLADVQRSLLERHKIEIAVTDGKRPKALICERCGLPFPPARKGPPARYCKKCHTAECDDCGAELSGSVLTPSAAAQRVGPPRCAACTKERRANLPTFHCPQCGCRLSKVIVWRHVHSAPGTPVPRCSRCREGAT